MATSAEIKKTMADAAQTGAAQAKQMATDGVAQARVAVEKTMETANKTAGDLMKASEEAVEFGRGNFEAVSKATQVYVTGMQDLSRQTVTMFQAYSEQAIEAAKTLTSLKSLKEAADFQASFAKTAFERAMADATRLQEASLKLAEAAVEPISARMTVAMEKMTKPLAA
ncbi:phasin family protein [Roseococcus sp. SYP-B2431]|uniref:phasin family protein n=1 Tax=Roseococcus sp. SYP-B2431 TaxID=2496640 RepID=UPI00103ACD78|nr:phasin family protein [Roseococcus sp. SYP-B2431]TCH98523.1 phasin family protein [Roseococcus sp. SYP-B2431]